MKNLRAQFNQSCVAGLLLCNNTSSLYSTKYTCIEVGNKGVNIQAGPGNKIFLNGIISGPGYTASTLPMDFLPTITNQTPRKTLDLSVITEVARTTIETISFLSLGL